MSHRKKVKNPIADVLNTNELFNGGKSGLCFYLPVYQRQFAWSKKNIDRYIDEIIEGIKKVNSAENAHDPKFDRIVYMGTVVCHKITDHTIYEKREGEVPGDVQVIIDGQQRVSVTLLTAIALHNLITIRKKEQAKFKEVDCEVYNEMETNIISELNNMLAESINKNKPENKIYIRMIKQVTDLWADETIDQKNVSPISFLISNYLGRKNDEIFILKEEKSAKKKFLFNKYDKIRKKIEGIINEDDSSGVTYPMAQTICDNTHLIEKLLGIKLKQSKIDIIDQYEEKLKEILSKIRISKNKCEINLAKIEKYKNNDNVIEYQNNLSKISAIKERLLLSEDNNNDEACNHLHKMKETLNALTNKQDRIMNDENVIAFIKCKAEYAKLEQQHEIYEIEHEDIIHYSNCCTENIKLILFANFFLHRLSFIKMYTEDFEYAERIFRTLNVSGDQLTPLETFYPIVNSKSDTVEQFSKIKGINDHMPSLMISLEEVNSCFVLEEEDQISRTSDFLTHFILAESGEGKVKKKTDQDKYLEYRYNIELKDSKSRVGFVTQMLSTVRVYAAIEKLMYDNISLNDEFNLCLNGSYSNYEDGKPAGPPINLQINRKRNHKQVMNEAIFCFEYLRTSPHRIPIALISRFYNEFLSAYDLDNEKLIEAHYNTCLVVRSTTAYWVLWRIWRDGTDNIDNFHRKIMSNRNFARKFDGHVNHKILADEYLRSLLEADKFTLKSSIDSDGNRQQSKRKWIIKSRVTELYGGRNKELAKFIILLDAYKDKSFPFSFSKDLWEYEAYRSIEHILPQTPENQVDDDYNQLINCIGNLTLLPEEVNSSIGNIDIEKRIEIYKILVSEEFKDIDDETCKELLRNNLLKTDLNELEAAVKKLMSIRRKIKEYKLETDIEFIPSLIDIIDDYKKHGDFGKEQIYLRGERILSNVWPILLKWIGIKETTPGNID